MLVEQNPSIANILRVRASETPHRVAYSSLRDGEVADTITYRGLHLRALVIAKALLDMRADGQVLLAYPSGLEYIAAFFGCLYAGLVAVPVYPPRPNRPDLRLAAIAADAQAGLALTSSQVFADAASRLAQQPGMNDLKWLATDTDVADTDASPVALPPLAGGDSLAYLQYTSGSTSTPKGVMVTHRSLLHTLEDLDRGWRHDADSVMVTWLPLFHDMGLIYGMLQPLYNGFPCYLMEPAAFLQRPSRWLEAVSRYRGTHSAAPNFAFDLCVQSVTDAEKARLDLGTWQMVLNAAEPVRADSLRDFAAAFARCGFAPQSLCPGYGLAESSLKVTAVRRGDGHKTLRVKADALLRGRVEQAGADVADVRVLIGCGRSEVGARVAIVNPETLTECPPDRVGEVWVSGDSVAQGYWRRSAETLETFGARLSDTGAGPFLRTGDLGFVADGELYLTGRLKDMIIIRGANHYPQDIELTVERSHPALRPGCGAAFAVDDGGEERLVIVQELKRTALRGVDADAVIHAVREAVALGHALTPHAVVLLRPASIPKTSSGKLQRRACRDAFLAGKLKQVAEWRQQPKASPNLINDLPATVDDLHTAESIEHWLLRKLAAGLGTDPSQLDAQEPFVRLGVDSLGAVRLSGELETLLDRNLPATLLFEHPSPRALARFLAADTSAKPALPCPSLPADNGKIAVIGLACRFPGAPDAQAFWRMLCAGVDNAAPPPPSRGFGAGAQAGYFLDGIDRFDAEFFGLSPREADNMDPQQRLLLEVAWEALENAGQADLAGSATGVFVGISSSDYFRMLLGQADTLNAHCGTGGALSIAANRLSYLLDLRGPSWAVDTACSSSLVAVHQACQSLRLGECDRALAAGVNLMLAPELTVVFSKARMLAADGRCKTFDADADGYGRGEGCGVVVLKRHADALRDGDTILAVLAGSAVNQDGRSNGLTAPNGLAQQDVVRRALRQAGFAPSAVSYVETHGTGTPLGDPIEINALKAVLSEGRAQHQACWLSSVKPNIGHLEAAAGIAGLIKTVLALRHRELPPHLHCQRLNPHIQLDGTALAIPTRHQVWAADGPRVAGVSAFGFGGTNAHVIVCEAEAAAPPRALPVGTAQIFTLSAKQAPALAALAQAYPAHLDANPAQALADVCFSANTGRAAFRHRLAVVANSTGQLRERLAATAEGQTPPGVWRGETAPSSRLKLAFLFTGQGCQHPGMGRELYLTQPAFRRALDECDAILGLKPSLSEVLYGTDAQHMLGQTAYAQPALFALEYALARLWQSWGIEASAVIGHSLGEYVAACVAGVFSLEDGLRLVAERGRLMQDAPGQGAMAAVFASEAQVRDVAGPWADIQIAALNAPNNTVMSGGTDSVAAALSAFDACGIKAKRLATSHAFHSALMQPVADAFEGAASTLRYAAPRIPLISNLTGQQVSAEITTPAYWRRHLLEPVRFAAGIETLAQLGCDAFLEIGPKPVLLDLARQCLPERQAAAWLPSLRGERGDGTETLLGSLAELYVRGAAVDWRGVHQGQPRQRVALPTYPFQRQRHWFQDSAQAADDAAVPQHWFHAPQWRAKPRTQAPCVSKPGVWLVFADAAGLGENLARELEATGSVCWRIYAQPLTLSADPRSLVADPMRPDAVWRAIDGVIAASHAPVVGVAYLWCVADSSIGDGLEHARRIACDTLINIVHALDHHRLAAKLWLVTRGAVPLEGTALAPPAAQALLKGVGKVVALEYPMLWGGMVDLPAQPEHGEVARLVLELRDAEGENRLAFRGGQRFVARLTPMAPVAHAPTRLAPDAAYLITGGLGVLGLKTAHWMARQGVRQLVLVSRRVPDAQADAAIRELESLGADVLAVQADVAEPQAVAALFGRLAKLLPLKGIVHAAGEADSRLIRECDPASPQTTALAAKVAGGWLLHQQSLDKDLDFFVCFSSIASVLGAQGQAYYAAANHFLDALAHYRHGLGLPALSVNWGPWGGGGMASGDYRRQLSRLGVRELPALQASAALGGLLGAKAAQVVVADVDWKLFDAHSPQPLLADLAPSPPPPAAKVDTAPPPFRQRLAKATHGEGQRLLVEHLQGEVARVLGFPASRKIDARQGFFDLGMDSLAALELNHHLEKLLGERLPPTLAFEMPNIESLATRLAALASPAGIETAKPAERDAPDIGLTEVRGLSERELELLIDQELQRSLQ